MTHRRGGVARSGDSGDERRRGWALRVAGATSRPLVAVVGPGVAGVDGGELGCGRRSSGGHGLAAAACKRAVACARNALRDAANALESPG